jgi:drug/metabolite transporter (DMT)-like permease
VGAGAAAGTASGAGFEGAAGAGAAAVPAGVAGWGTDDGKTNGELYAAPGRHFVRRAGPACHNRRVSPSARTPSASPAAGPAVAATVGPLPARHAGPSPYLLLTLTPLFWACNWIVGRGLAADIPPMAMTFLRWFFALLILAPFAWPHLRRDWPIVRRHWRTLTFLGAIGVGTHNALAYLGLNYTTATNGVILNSFIPVMIVALSRVFLRERLTPLQLFGVGVSLAGVLTILSGGSLAALAAFRLNQGDLLVILSMAMWSVYTICLRWRPPGLHLLTFLFVLACVGDLAVLPLFLGELAWGRHMQLTATNVGALVSVALFSSVLAYIFWNRGVELVGANVAGLFVHLMPVFGVVLAWLFLDERLAPFHLAGIALILAGIVVTSRYAPPRGAAPVPAGTD